MDEKRKKEIMTTPLNMLWVDKKRYGIWVHIADARKLELLCNQLEEALILLSESDDQISMCSDEDLEDAIINGFDHSIIKQALAFKAVRRALQAAKEFKKENE